ncbi:hypothetical protein [Nitrosomonas sp.]|uniref:beta strand repeat-containing protein n=1 Tax=Nitrosomonas sp. TaxID=42353 RepID=UPI0026181A5D|nr:hypothetical protein [Nitrosomonas sp.]
MAITPTQRDDILKVVVGLFNGSPNGNVLTELSDLVKGGTSIEDLADSLAAHSAFQDNILAGNVTIDDQVAILMDHFGLVADDDETSAGSQAEAYFTQKLEDGEGFGKIVFDAVTYLSSADRAPEFDDAAALLNNKIQVAKLYAQSNPSDDLDTMLSVLNGVSASTPVTQAEALAYLDSIGQGSNPGGSFDLTFGDDALVGTAGNDTFNGGVVNNGAGTLVQSWEDIDTVDGGAGTDTLNATLDGSAAITPSISNVEVINIRNVTADASVDFTDASGVQQIWNNASSATRTLTYDAAPIAATFGVRNTQSTTEINTFDDVTGTDDTLALSTAGAGKDDTTRAVVQSTTDAAAIEAMSIAAAGENFLDVSGFTAITTLTVTGTGSLDVLVDTTALDTVDASANKGGVTTDLSASAIDLTVTGGTGADDITAGTANDTIDVGAGDDRVAFTTGTLDADDVVEGGDGEDTLALLDGDDVAGLTADGQTGFEVLELGAAGAAVTFDNTDFGFTKVVLGADLTQDLTLEHLDATLEVKDNQAGDINVISGGTDDTFGLSINAEEVVPTVTLAALDVTDIETVNVSTTADTDDTIFTTIETDGVTALTFAGAGDVSITDITDADNANNGTTKIASIDLTDQTGGFEMAANNLGYGTTFTLANLGETATATYDFDDDATNDEASELFGAAGFRDRFEFTTEFTGDVAIQGVEVGGDVSDDKIDLSFFGLTSDDDLTITDVADGTLIENDAFGGGRILLVGVTSTEVNATDFVF